MRLFDKTLSYFRELSLIPRKSHHEEKVRNWLISWAKSHNWECEADSIWNLLVIATTQKSKLKNQNLSPLCLQSHMDMVCVSREPHDWSIEGITVIEENGILKGRWTTLGADNGIGVAVMMAIAEIGNRPTLELLFTMGEEVGLIGAHNIKLPLIASYGINLDWCHSETIGIGCGGTLLIEWNYTIMTNEEWIMNNGEIYNINISGMLWGHSGADILENRWNALVELSQIISENQNIKAIGEIRWGDADNAIPRSASAKILVSWERELHNWIQIKTLEIREKTGNNRVEITLEKTEYEGDFYQKDILSTFVVLWSGIQICWKDKKTPLSSWNLGKMKLTEGVLTWCYFLRTNIPWGITPMKQKILSTFNEWKRLNWELNHESPVWLSDADSPFVRKIWESIESVHGKKIPAMTTHATVEVGTLAEKYPNTEWVSIGATCHDMHTTNEHIYLADLEEFCERLERVIQSY